MSLPCAVCPLPVYPFSIVALSPPCPLAWRMLTTIRAVRSIRATSQIVRVRTIRAVCNLPSSLKITGLTSHSVRGRVRVIYLIGVCVASVLFSVQLSASGQRYLRNSVGCLQRLRDGLLVGFANLLALARDGPTTSAVGVSPLLTGTKPFYFLLTETCLSKSRCPFPDNWSICTSSTWGCSSQI